MSGGLSVRQRALARGQRAAKAQPGGTLKGEGISPESGAMDRLAAGSGTKLEESSARV